MLRDQLRRTGEYAGEFLNALFVVPAGGEVDHELKTISSIQDLHVQDRLGSGLILTHVDHLDPRSLQ